MNNPPEMSFAQMESENCRLRAELVELRALYTDVAEKLGTVSGLVGFEPDRVLPVIIDQVQMKLAMIPAMNQRNLMAAARWVENKWRETKGETGILVEDQTENSWTGFAHSAAGLLEALRKR